MNQQAGAAEEVLTLLRRKLEECKQEETDKVALQSRHNRAKDKEGPEVRL